MQRCRANAAAMFRRSSFSTVSSSASLFRLASRGEIVSNAKPFLPRSSELRLLGPLCVASAQWDNPVRIHQRGFHSTHLWEMFAQGQDQPHIPHKYAEERSSTDTSACADEWESFTADPRNALLDSALKHVMYYGWSMEALAKGAEELGYSGVAPGMFSRGPVELVEYWLDQVDAMMKVKVQQLDLSSMNMKERVKALLRARLELFIPVITSWQQALGLLAHPTNMQRSLTRLHNTISDLLYVAGDSSTDFDWYTKRALVGTAYISTELYMLTDGSENFQQTWEFLGRRIDEIATLSTYKAEVSDIVRLASGFATTVLSAAATSTQNPESNLGNIFANAPSNPVAQGAEAISKIFNSAAQTASSGSPQNAMSTLINVAASVFESVTRGQPPTTPTPTDENHENPYEDEIAMSEEHIKVVVAHELRVTPTPPAPDSMEGNNSPLEGPSVPPPPGVNPV